MKILIAYFSRTGITKKAVDRMRQILNCDTDEIKCDKNYGGMKGYFAAGTEVNKKALTEAGSSKDPASYDLVIVAGPVWAWTLSTPVRSYLTKNKEVFKNLAAFCTMGGNNGKYFEEIEQICNKKLIARQAFKDKEILAGKADEQIKSYCATILNNINLASE